MKVKRISEIMEKAILALPSDDRKRLRYHLDAKTVVLCGRQSDVYTDGHGGG